MVRGEGGQAAEAPPQGARGVPRWPGLLAALVLALLFVGVASAFELQSPWVPAVVIFGLLAPLSLAVRGRQPHIARRLALILHGLVTCFLLVGAAVLIDLLTSRGLAARSLLLAAALLWVANVLVFAIWYWEIDGGGPARRHSKHHASGDLLFPQMQGGAVAPGWSPGFVDYLFVAFTASTAFSPTDTLPLSRRVKLLMMLQSGLSLVIIGVLLARAINTL